MCGELLCKQGDEEQGPSGLEVFFSADTVWQGSGSWCPKAVWFCVNSTSSAGGCVHILSRILEEVLL